MKTAHSARALHPHPRQPAYSRLSKALLLSLAVAAAPAMAQSATGNTDPDSWVDEEFQADWGLGAINAHYAYARGLTGKGIRLGVFDSGVAAGHSEFAGKDLRSIRLADPGCASADILTGPDACFISDGNTVAIDYLDYTAEDKALVEWLVISAS